MARRAQVWIVVSGVLLLASPAAWPATPRLRFEVGKEVTYKLSHTTAAVFDGEEVMRMSFETAVVLKPLEVGDDGTAEIELVTTTTSRSAKTKTPVLGLVPLPTNGPSSIAMTVSSDGRITSLRDMSGQPYHIITNSPEGRSEAHAARRELVGTYLLFGLQLPETLPAVGETWRGETTQECMVTGGDKAEWQYSRAPVTYTYKGVEQYQGRACEVIATDGEFVRPSTCYFDAAAGELVGLEHHLKEPLVMDVVLRLAPCEEGREAPPKE